MTGHVAMAPRMTPALAARDVTGVARRNLLHIVRTPQLLVVSAIQPAMILVLLRYVLGGAIHVPGGSYVDYAVPAVFGEAVLIGGMTTSAGLAQDLKTGIIDRFRVRPWPATTQNRHAAAHDPGTTLSRLPQVTAECPAPVWPAGRNVVAFFAGKMV
jgi:hypothetical protein